MTTNLDGGVPGSYATLPVAFGLSVAFLRALRQGGAGPILEHFSRSASSPVDTATGSTVAPPHPAAPEPSVVDAAHADPEAASEDDPTTRSVGAGVVLLVVVSQPARRTRIMTAVATGRRWRNWRCLTRGC